MGLSKSETAYTYIKNKIITGELAPLVTISEEALQNELSMSRTPIREALLQLQTENFLEVYPRNGIVVAPVTFEFLNEIYEMRRVVEPYIFCTACDKLPAGWLVQMRNRFVQAPVSIEDFNNNSYFQNLDLEFCSVVLQAAGNRLLQDSMRRAYDHSRRVCALSTRPLDTLKQDTQEHITIIDNMIIKDLDKLKEAVLQHVEHTRKNAFTCFLNAVTVV